MSLFSVARPAERRGVRPLSKDDLPAALELCARNPAANVYPAARLLELDLDRSRGAVLGYAPGGQLEALCWASANVVPVECDGDAAAAFASRLRRSERRFSSIFGPADQVTSLWSTLSNVWHEPLGVRPDQPLLAIDASAPLGISPDPTVRVARAEELDAVVPAAAAMFTEEIGYRPFSERTGESGYRASVAGLISRGHCFVRMENGEVVFKADVGSAALGAAQIQGVWVAPRWRGRGIAAPAMASVVAHVWSHIAPVVTLYVNDYNLAALATYRRVGFSPVGTFATVLL